MHGQSVAVPSNNTQLNSGGSSNKLQVVDRGGGGDDSDKENRWENAGIEQDRKLNGCGRKLQQLPSGSSFGEENCCASCLQRFESVIRRIEPAVGYLEQKTREGGNERRKVVVEGAPVGPTSGQKKKHQQRELAPLQISINVVDPDNNNLNVCLCSAGPENNEQDDEVDQVQLGSEDRICRRCQKMVNQQPLLGPGKAFTSQRLTLARDIIVNRIDTQFLNTTGSGGNRRVNYEPYTPDSMESHSPMLLGLSGELQSSSSFTTTQTDATTATKCSSASGSSYRVEGEDGRQQQQGDVGEPPGTSVPSKVNLDLIESEEMELGENQKLMNSRPDIQTQSSVEHAGELATGGNKNGLNTSGVSAKQLKFRLEKLQILSRMPGHGDRKSEIGGRIEFEDKMRKREEKKEMKELKKLQKGKGLSAFQDKRGNGAGERNIKSKSQCSVM